MITKKCNYTAYLNNETLTNWDIRFLELAEFISFWSKDPSTKVGSVIVENKRIISLGFNGLPQKVEDSEKRLNNRDIKYKLIIHAERNALLFADLAHIRNGYSTIYTWPFMPCATCAGMIIQAGIRRVVAPYNDVERWQGEFALARELFEEAKIPLLEVGYDDECCRDL